MNERFDHLAENNENSFKATRSHQPEAECKRNQGDVSQADRHERDDLTEQERKKRRDELNRDACQGAE